MRILVLSKRLGMLQDVQSCGVDRADIEGIGAPDLMAAAKRAELVLIDLLDREPAWLVVCGYAYGLGRHLIIYNDDGLVQVPDRLRQSAVAIVQSMAQLSSVLPSLRFFRPLRLEDEPLGTERP